jgi:NAD(P)-dependent dehydrogenase (short-subunit alcohol dehydrogenase family)
VMKAQGYGRIVNITSSSMTGFANQVAYATSKGGVWSLTRALAAEGEAFGVKVNAVSPGGYTRLVISTLEDDSPLLAHAKQELPPQLSSPAVAFLAHASCPVTGECIDSVGGEVQRCHIARTLGFNDRNHTIETIAARWTEVMDTQGAVVVGLAAMDTSGWGLRAYDTTNSS